MRSLRPLTALALLAAPVAALALLAAPATALAVPTVLPLHGNLTDAEGVPREGSVSATFELLAADTDEVVWTETRTVELAAGNFTIYLGEQSALDSEVFRDHAGLSLKIVVDGEAMGPVDLGHVAYAAWAEHAGDADTLEGTTLTEITDQIPTEEERTTLIESVATPIAETAARDLAYDTPLELHTELDARYLVSAGDGIDVTANVISVVEADLTDLLDDDYATSAGNGLAKSTTGEFTVVEADLTTLLDDNYVYTAGTGLSLTGNEFAVDEAALVTLLEDDFADIDDVYTKSEVDSTFLTQTDAATTYAEIEDVYTQEEVDDAIQAAVANPAALKAVPKAWTVYGDSTACHTGSSATVNTYTTIDDMEIDFTLDGDYVVYVQFDATLANSTSGAWVATKLDIDGTADTRANHTQPLGMGYEEDSHRLFRIEELEKGDHTIKALWGYGSGEVCSYSNWNASRRMTVIAIPVESGVQYGYTEGSTTRYCHTASGGTWRDITDLDLEADLDEDSVVLSMYAITWDSGSTTNWVGTRLEVSGSSDGGVHTQRYQTSEDEQQFHFQIDELAKGKHDIVAQSGQGSGTVCNNTHQTEKVWDRRLGWIAFPESSGVKFNYANPKGNYSKSGQSHATVPGLSYETFLPYDAPSWLALHNYEVNFYVNGNGQWAATRWNVDGQPETLGHHNHKNINGEDAILGSHRVDFWQPGHHRVSTEWWASSTVYSPSNSSSSIWTTRQGSIYLPIKSYAE